MGDQLRARRPMSYDTEPCEGWQASPSNPAKAPKRQLAETVVLRCTAQEKDKLKAQAEAAGVTISALLRATLGLVKPTRRRAAPKVDPRLVAELSRIGTNLNQIARAVNTATSAGEARQLNGLQIITELTAIDRQLGALLALHQSEEPGDAD